MGEFDVGISQRDLFQGLRSEALGAAESGIVEVSNYGRGRQGLIPLWVGEGDMPTPAFICEAATRSLAAGETFYTDQRGIPDLRAAIARYMTRWYGGFDGAPFSHERFFVTVGGMHALQVAVRLVAGAGDEVLVPTPAWPNFAAALSVSGAATVEVPMAFEDAGAAPQWRLNIDHIRAAITPRTRALVVNTPSNPLGIIASRAELEALLDLARKKNLWIIADEIYGRLVFGAERAPSFHDIMRADDKILFVQTFSKNWAMTGWRIGWLEAPAALGAIIENLIQYSTSGVPVFQQRAAIAALERGEDLLAHQISRMTESRDILCDGLARTGRMRFARPEGAFYLFGQIEGVSDSRALVLRLVDEAGVGLAPGSAFGAAGEGFVRICYARKAADMAEATRRLVRWLAQK